MYLLDYPGMGLGRGGTFHIPASRDPSVKASGGLWRAAKRSNDY